jgi:hypothetical protein
MLTKQNFSLSVIISVILFTSNIFGEVQHLDFWTFMEKRKEDANFRLNFENFKEVLNNAPHTSERITSKSILAMPTFTGKKTDFKFYKNSVMHPNLAKRYPNISTFVGVGVENPAYRATIVINDDIVIGSVESENGKSHFKSFDIYSENNELLVYNEAKNYQDLVCKPFNDHVNQTRDFPECLGTDDPCYPAGVELVTYRFAAMITESVNNSDADGTVEGGLTWLVGAVAYVNALYVRDVTFQLQIVDNNDELIFTDNNPAPEVFNQDCGGPWETLGCELGVVDSVLDSRIGPGGWDAEDEVRVWDYGALFDNGHPGGLAYCPGPTSAQVPDMWVFSHEVMHNFGSPHNYSGEGGIRTSIGGTIMAHRVNETFNMFSTHSTEYALNYQETVGPYGNWWYHNGYTEELTDNTIPQISLPEGGFTIPSETPFVLEGSSEPMDESYTYSWESNDGADEPYSPDPNSTEFPFFLPDQGSLFVPVTPHPNGYKRVFPEMEVLLENEYEKFGVDPYTSINQIVEKLPFATREMNMRLVVRTNDPYAGTLNHKNLKFYVDGAAGPFRITSQSDSTIWEVGSDETITWDVANTDDPNGVNCQAVDILLSLNGDGNFDFIIAESVPNTGSYTFTIAPTIPTDSTRVMIRASDNIFFDINNGKINIQNANIPSISLSDEMIESSLPNDSLSTISIGITNNGEEGSVLSYQSYTGTDFQFDIGFDDGNLPDDWSTSTNAECDNPGWFISEDASSSYFTIPPGDGYYIATNDDACNSDGSNDMLFTGPIQLPDAHLSLSFLRYFSAGFSQSFHVLISTDNWETSTELLNLGYWEGNDEEWLQETINLNAYAGDVVDIAFHSNDNGNWASGGALDDIRLGVIPTWINSDGSGYANYMETSQIDISINANGMEPGFYESKVVVQSMTTDEKDTVDLQLTVEDALVGLDQTAIPLVFSLSQNYPNPFNPNTTLDYSLPIAGSVHLAVYDLLGHEIVILVDGYHEPGYKSITWNGIDKFGNDVSTGMYFYKLRSGDFEKVKKMVLLK